MVFITFECEVDTCIGQSVYIVGDHHELGNWTPGLGKPLNTNKYIYPKWCTKPISFEFRDIIKFKFLIVTEDKGYAWENITNRVLDLNVIYGNQNEDPALTIYQSKFDKNEIKLKSTYGVIRANSKVCNIKGVNTSIVENIENVHTSIEENIEGVNNNNENIKGVNNNNENMNTCIEESTKSDIANRNINIDIYTENKIATDPDKSIYTNISNNRSDEDQCITPDIEHPGVHVDIPLYSYTPLNDVVYTKSDKYKDDLCYTDTTNNNASNIMIAQISSNYTNVSLKNESKLNMPNHIYGYTKPHYTTPSTQAADTPQDNCIVNSSSSFAEVMITPTESDSEMRLTQENTALPSSASVTRPPTQTSTCWPAKDHELPSLGNNVSHNRIFLTEGTIDSKDSINATPPHASDWFVSIRTFYLSCCGSEVLTPEISPR